MNKTLVSLLREFIVLFLKFILAVSPIPFFLAGSSILIFQIFASDSAVMRNVMNMPRVDYLPQVDYGNFAIGIILTLISMILIYFSYKYKVVVISLMLTLFLSLIPLFIFILYFKTPFLVLLSTGYTTGKLCILADKMEEKKSRDIFCSISNEILPSYVSGVTYQKIEFTTKSSSEDQ